MTKKILSNYRIKYFGSMRVRIALLFSLIIAILLLIIFSYLYFFLHKYFNNEAKIILNERVMLINDILLDSPDETSGLNTLKHRIETEWISPNHEPLWVQIQLPDGTIFAKSPLFLEDSNKKFLEEKHKVQLRSTIAPYINVTLKLDRSKENSLLLSYGFKMLGVFVLSIFLSIYSTFKMISFEIFPLLKMSRKMKNITLKSLNRQIDSTHFPTELVPVAQSFNIMLNKLEKSFDQMKRFSGDIAHEMRTPLNALLIKIEVMLERPRSIDEYQDLLESLHKDARGLSRLIDTLLFLARAENPNRTLQFENLSLNSEIQSIIEFYEPLASDKSMIIVFESHAELSQFVEKSLFDRALGNLIQNSIQYCKVGSRITIRLAGDSNEAVIEVADNGPGIESIHLPFLFDRLYRVDPSRDPNSGSLGLGLSIVASIMKLHDGKISIESDFGVGTCFRLSFPNLRRNYGQKLFKK